MNPMEIAALETVMVSLVVAGTFLTTVVLVLKAWTRRGSVGRREAADLLEAMDTLTHSIDEMRGEVSDISDRLEFAERLLTRVAESTQAGGQQLPGEH